MRDNKLFHEEGEGYIMINKDALKVIKEVLLNTKEKKDTRKTIDIDTYAALKVVGEKFKYAKNA